LTVFLGFVNATYLSVGWIKGRTITWVILVHFPWPPIQTPKLVLIIFCRALFLNHHHILVAATAVPLCKLKVPRSLMAINIFVLSVSPRHTIMLIDKLQESPSRSSFNKANELSFLCRRLQVFCKPIYNLIPKVLFFLQSFSSKYFLLMISLSLSLSLGYENEVF
jgi:hypothetical protein